MQSAENEPSGKTGRELVGGAGGRKENQNKPQNNQRRVKAAAAQEAGGLQVITSCLGTLWP